MNVYLWHLCKLHTSFLFSRSLPAKYPPYLEILFFVMPPVRSKATAMGKPLFPASRGQPAGPLWQMLETVET